MTWELAAARSSRAVIVAVLVAAIAVTAFSIVGIAVLMGWMPRGGVTAPIGIASPGQQVTGTAPPPDPAPAQAAVAPIEASKRPEPLMPKYSQPTPPAPAPAEVPAETTPRKPPVITAAPRKEPPATPAPRETETAAPRYNPDPAQAPRGEPRPGTPSYARTQPQRPPASTREPAPGPGAGACETCGTVSTITTYPGLWEVRVRFETGSSRTFRLRSRPAFGVGDRVRLEDDRLVAD